MKIALLFGNIGAAAVPSAIIGSRITVARTQVRISALVARRVDSVVAPHEPPRRSTDKLTRARAVLTRPVEAVTL